MTPSSPSDLDVRVSYLLCRALCPRTPVRNHPTFPVSVAVVAHPYDYLMSSPVAQYGPCHFFTTVCFDNLTCAGDVSRWAAPHGLLVRVAIRTDRKCSLPFLSAWGARRFLVSAQFRRADLVYLSIRVRKTLFGR